MPPRCNDEDRNACQWARGENWERYLLQLLLRGMVSDFAVVVQTFRRVGPGNDIQHGLVCCFVLNCNLHPKFNVSLNGDSLVIANFGKDPLILWFFTKGIGCRQMAMPLVKQSYHPTCEPNSTGNTTRVGGHCKYSLFEHQRVSVHSMPVFLKVQNNVRPTFNKMFSSETKRTKKIREPKAFKNLRS